MATKAEQFHSDEERAAQATNAKTAEAKAKHEAKPDLGPKNSDHRTRSDAALNLRDENRLNTPDARFHRANPQKK